MVIILLAEDVLFLECISFTERLNDIVKYVCVRKIQISIRTILLHGVLYLNDYGAVPLCGKQYRVKVLPLLVLHILQLGE